MAADDASGGRGGLVREAGRGDVFYLDSEHGRVELHVERCGSEVVRFRIKAPPGVKIQHVDAGDIAGEAQTA